MRILMALSGGVDSSTALVILRQHQIDGTIPSGASEPIESLGAAYIKTWMHEENPISDCSWEDDIKDGRAVCQTLNVPFEVVNLIEHYRRHVVSLLVEGYRHGITPNPDIACNRFVKFGAFLDYAKSNGYTHVATGHYCQRSLNPDGSVSLLEGADPNKDQSYFLAQVSSQQLSSALFPIGGLLKPEVRAIAEKYNLPTAAKKDSQGICFLGKVKVNDFLAQYIQNAPGPIVNHHGKTLGEHNGLHNFTLGQRHGIGIPSNTDNEFYVVAAKDYTTNTLHIAFDHPQTAPQLYRTTFELRNLHWIGKQPLDLSQPVEILARPRYRDPKVEAILSAIEPTDQPNSPCARIVFSQPQRALTPGQIVAFHDKNRLIGSAIYC